MFNIDDYQAGWLDALNRVIELSHLSKEDILQYARDKHKEIDNER